ncbi:MAG: glycosyltransferase family 39 protein [Parcubacteria group bacterium]|nr:glycosyltransferase family 39 protein [Parcubacteria group bacterium]
MPSKYNTIALILIITIAIFFRFWQFNSIPPGLYQDEAMNGADALSSLESGKLGVFYTNNNGREGMIVWLDALAIKVFGTEPWVLRLFPALAGVLAVLVLFFLAKELFSVEIALASSFFMATSFWAVNFSRIGFRAGLMLPILIWSFYFLYRGFKLLTSDVDSDYRHRMSDFITAGILFGLGFYTYISYRFAPILVAAFFIPYLLKHHIKNLWLGFAIFAITAFIVALPIGLYFINNSGDFFGRSRQVSIFSADNPLKASVLSIAATLGMFNIIGDLNSRHNFAGSPQLLLPVGILFILGILICAKRRNLSDKFLLLWFFIFLLPNILSTEGNPHALRALGAMPAAMIFAGIGLIWLYQKVKGYFDKKIKNLELEAYRGQLLRIKKEVFILLFIFLLFISFSEFNKYFIKWASNIRTADAFSQSHVKIADYLNLSPRNVKKYVIWPVDDRPTENGLPVSAQTIYFLTYGKSDINYVKFNESDKINLGANGAIIATLNSDLDLLHDLNKKFPSGKIEFIYLNTPILIVP